ncbi:hypothetical protein NDA01_24335 [Trichocoleus desertorum AS-A10]|uniref:hypothetical protein n=1 Tax=Trichocoleus desertorum TaxID=1481672 RepID=UPI003299B245
MLSDRLSQVEKSLTRLREQLAGKEDALTTIAPEERVRIKQQISDLKAEIKPFEEEYWQILTERAGSSEIADLEAEVVIAEIVERAEPLQRNSQYSPEVLDLLQKIYIEVSKPETSAAAKLKGALSLLPPFISLSYEAEIDTENFLQTHFPTFRRWARSLAKKKIIVPEHPSLAEQLESKSYNNSSRSEGIKVENYLDIFGNYDLDALSEGLVDPLEKGKLVFFNGLFATTKFLGDLFPIFASTENLAHEASVINSIAFSKNKGELWGGSISEKSKRNCSHARKNPNTLLLFKSANDQNCSRYPKLSLEWLGFTHVIPVNLEVWTRYLNGEIEDNSFPSDYISSQEDETYGLIIFSLALYRNWFSKDKYGFNKSLNDVQSLIKVLIYHLGCLIDIHFYGKQEVPILTQTDSKYFSNFLERNNFIKHPVNSADNCPIYLSRMCINAD